MKETVVTIYECEHCKKYYKRKHFAVKHELFCKKNPINRHRCFEFCTHLSKRTETEEGDDFFPDRSYTTFYCAVTGEEMHSYIAQRRGMHICGYTERMPLECKSYRGEWDQNET